MTKRRRKRSYSTCVNAATPYACSSAAIFNVRRYAAHFHLNVIILDRIILYVFFLRANECNRSLTEKPQLEKNSRDVVAIGLQDEIELLQQKVVNLETLLQTERGLTSELCRDKEAFKSLSFYAYSRVQRDNFNYHNCPKRNGFKPNRKAGD